MARHYRRKQREYKRKHNKKEIIEVSYFDGETITIDPKVGWKPPIMEVSDPIPNPYEVTCNTHGEVDSTMPSFNPIAKGVNRFLKGIGRIR